MTAHVKLLRRPTRPPHVDGPPRAGFVLYVGLDEDPADPADARGELAEVAEALRDLARDLLPTAETFTALSLVPTSTAPDDVGSLRARLARLAPLPEADDTAPDVGETPGPAPTGVRVDLDARRVTVDGEPVPLTFMELELLVHLVRATHRVVGRDELLHTVWRGVGRPGTRTIDVHVRRLRSKLPTLVLTTVRGVGYRLEPGPGVELVGQADAG